MGTVSQIWLSLESNKNEHSRGWRWSCKCSCPQVNVLFFFLKIKNILLFQELLFYYPELPFYLRFLIAFQSISLVFQKNLLFIYCKCFFFPRMLFFSLLYLLLVLLRASQKDDICLAVVSFPLGTLCWPNYYAFLIPLKTST